LQRGDYVFPKTLKFSIEGLEFVNNCLQFDPKKRMSFDEMLTHPYITSDPRVERADALMMTMAGNGDYDMDHD
jgi:hypothetical protein